MSGSKELPDLIAVAMPLYGHAALALEAIESVLASNLRSCRVVMVISVDGDPRHETFDQLLLYAAAHPSVHVVFGENAGPGGARNRAIEFILENFPEARAVYFLDAETASCPARSRRSTPSSARAAAAGSTPTSTRFRSAGAPTTATATRAWSTASPTTSAIPAR